MLNKIDYIIQEIKKVENFTLEAKQEIKILRRRIGAYKGWLTRYRKQREEFKKEVFLLKSSYSLARQERDDLQKELNLKKEELSHLVKQAKDAKEGRDKAIYELDKLIEKIELFKVECQKISQIHYADKTHLIKQAERLLFEEDLIIRETELINNREHPQMFTDTASVNRSLLDR